MTIPSVNPSVPFMTTIAMVGFSSEKALWDVAVVVPVGSDGIEVYGRVEKGFLMHLP